MEIHTTISPETRAELERLSAERFGTTRAVGRLLDEDYVKSRPYEPTNDQRRSRFLIRAYTDRLTEEETIERLFRELERARDWSPDRPGPGEDCPTCERPFM